MPRARAAFLVFVAFTGKTHIPVRWKAKLFHGPSSIPSQKPLRMHKDASNTGSSELIRRELATAVVIRAAKVLWHSNGNLETCVRSQRVRHVRSRAVPYSYAEIP